MPRHELLLEWRPSSRAANCAIGCCIRRRLTESVTFRAISEIGHRGPVKGESWVKVKKVGSG
jgi:hypothetical protein